MPHESDLNAGSEPSFALAQSESAFSGLVHCSESKPYAPGPEMSGAAPSKRGENESKFDLSRGAERIFEKFVVVPTGIEPVFPT